MPEIQRSRAPRHRATSSVPVRAIRRAGVASAVDRLQRGAGNATLHRVLAPALRGPRNVQRACRECEEEKAQEVSSEVASYLSRGPAGRPLAESARAFFEPRFGRDFSNVRVHTDRPAADSAAELQARAYTVGSNVFFGRSEYSPDSGEGRKLLAHELTHVVQQDGADAAAMPTISRFASVTCTTGRHGAPANAEDIIDAAETLAVAAIALAQMDLQMLRLDIVLPGLGAGGGFAMPANQRVTNYQNSFGLPPRVSGGRFQDRLGRGTYPSRGEALFNESQALENRFERIADRIANGVRYRCIGGSTTIGDCEGHCRGRTATACLGSNLIMLCPQFWSDSMRTQTFLLIHEVAHLAFNIRHGANFSHADCYANYAADAGTGGWNGIPPCAP